MANDIGREPSRRGSVHSIAVPATAPASAQPSGVASGWSGVTTKLPASVTTSTSCRAGRAVTRVTVVGSTRPSASVHSWSPARTSCAARGPPTALTGWRPGTHVEYVGMSVTSTSSSWHSSNVLSSTESGSV